MKLDSSAFVAREELIEALARISSDVPCDNDRVLFEQGESPTGLYILHTGNAMLSMRAPNGEDVLSGVASNGSLLGLPAVVGNMPYSLTVTVAKGSKVGFVTREKFSILMVNEPALAVQVLQVLTAEVRSARNGMIAR